AGLTCWSRLRTSKPVNLGISRSSSMRCGASCSMRSSASTPSRATTVPYPEACNRSSSIVAISGSSSTMRIFAFILTFHSWEGEADSDCARRAATALSWGSASNGIVLTLPLLLHHINDESRQRFRKEVRRLVGHTFTGCRNGLYFIDPCRIEQEGSGAGSL